MPIIFLQASFMLLINSSLKFQQSLITPSITINIGFR